MAKPKHEEINFVVDILKNAIRIDKRTIKKKSAPLSLTLENLLLLRPLKLMEIHSNNSTMHVALTNSLRVDLKRSVQ